MYRALIEELEVVNKMVKKIDKIIKSNEFTKKWYDLGHIKVFGLCNGTGLLPIVEVWRLNPDDDGDPESAYMDKQTKDRITSFLKKNDCIYFERHECYIYGGDILKKIKKFYEPLRN